MHYVFTAYCDQEQETILVSGKNEIAAYRIALEKAMIHFSGHKVSDIELVLKYIQ